MNAQRSNRRSPGERIPRDQLVERWIEGRHLAVLVGQKPWSGSTACVLVTWCPVGWLSADDWTQLKGELELGAHMKRKERKNASEQKRAATDEQFGADYPNLYDYLTATCYDDDPKQPRQVATLLVFAQDGCFKACLRDRAESLCCWVAAPDLLGVLGVLESELDGGTAVWREDRLSGAETAKRKPRGNAP